MDTKLQKKIMRRIYTAYGMRILGGTRARYFMVMVLSAWGLMSFVSVMDVARNFSHVSVGEVGNFALSAVLNTDIWTLAISALFVYAAVIFIKGESTLSRGRFA